MLGKGYEMKSPPQTHLSTRLRSPPPAARTEEAEKAEAWDALEALLQGTHKGVENDLLLTHRDDGFRIELDEPGPDGWGITLGFKPTLLAAIHAAAAGERKA